AVLPQAQRHRGLVDPPLWIVDIDAGDLVEGDTDVVIDPDQQPSTCPADPPGTGEPRQRRQTDAVIVEARGQSIGIPLGGAEMHLVPVADQASRQTGDVGLAAAAPGQDARMAQCDLHTCLQALSYQLSALSRTKRPTSDPLPG